MSSPRVIGEKKEPKPPSDAADIVTQKQGMIFEAQDQEGHSVYYEIIGQLCGAKVDGKDMYRRVLVRKLKLNEIEKEKDHE